MADLLPFPYWAPVLDLLPHPLGHLAFVTVYPQGAPAVPLESVESLKVTFSEDWAPFAQADVTIPASDNEALLSVLDPRLNCRLRISAGYVYPDGREDAHPLADVALRERETVRPDDLLSLKAASDEARTQDNRVVSAVAVLPRAGVNEAVAWLLGQALAPETAQLVSDFPARHKAAALEEMEIDLGADYWSLLDDVAARTGCRVWCDESRVWRIGARPERAGSTSLDLTVGENGTLLRTNAGLSREPWANTAVLRYRWTDAAGAERVRIGRARVQTGPYSVPVVGAKVHYEEIDRPATQAAADAAAASRLRNLFTRGRSLTLRAGAAYWLRPGMTISVTLPGGNPEDHLVQSVSFEPLLGLMDVVTRQPMQANITNGE